MKMILTKNLLFLLLLFICFQTARAVWTKQNSNTLAWLQDVYFLNEKTGWVVGSNGTFLATNDGGKSWTKEKNLTRDNIRQVHFTDASNGWLLCERDIYALGASSPSYLLRTADGGVYWERIEFADHQRKRITKFFFAKNGTGFAVGEGGALFAMTDDKRTWKRLPSPMRHLMFDGVFTNDSNAVVVGAGGSILLTDDAGSSWNKALVFGNSETKLNSVFFINREIGWTVGGGGKILHTVNGGKAWREQKSNVAMDLADIFFRNAADGWAVGDEGAILRTDTAGNFWTAVESGAKHKLERVFFAGKKGWAVGFGGTILAYDEDVENANPLLSLPKFRIEN